METLLMKKIPFISNGIKCLIKEAEFTTLRNIHIEVCVPHRVGQTTRVLDSRWIKYPGYIGYHDTYYCNIDSSIFSEWADKYELYKFIVDSFCPILCVNLQNEEKASKELFIIYC